MVAKRGPRHIAAALIAGLTLVMAGCAPAAPPTQPPTQPPATAAAAAKPAAAPTAAVAAPSPPAAPIASPVPSVALSPMPGVAVASPATVARQFNEQAVADFYRGKTIRLVVGYGAGGGYDTYSRVIGRYLGKYIPGNPTVIVENMPGAGGLLAATNIAKVAPKDGTVIGNFGITGVFEAIVSGSTADFDAAALQYLNMPSVDDILCVATRASGFKSLAETLGPNSKQMVVGISSNPPDEVGILRAALSANLKPVGGYNGTAAIRLAMDQGEVDGQCSWSWQSVATTAMDRIQSGDYVVIAQVVGDVLNAALPPSTPLASQLATTDEARQLLLYGMTLPRQFQREYVFAPGVPMDRVQAVRTAFDRVLKDPDLRLDAQKSQLDISPLTGEEAGKRVQDMINMPAGVRAKLKQIADTKT